MVGVEEKKIGASPSRVRTQSRRQQSKYRLYRVPPFENTFGRLTLHPATRVCKQCRRNVTRRPLTSLDFFLLSFLFIPLLTNPYDAEIAPSAIFVSDNPLAIGESCRFCANV